MTARRNFCVCCGLLEVNPKLSTPYSRVFILQLCAQVRVIKGNMIASSSRHSTRYLKRLPLALVIFLAIAWVGCGGGSSSSAVQTGPGNGGGGGGGGAAATPATFFGMHVNHLADNPPWPNVPVAGLRMWDDETSWAQTNTGPGAYDWSNLDFWVGTALSNKADILYDLARTPGWAQCSNSDVNCGSGDTSVTCFYATIANEGGPGECFPPADLHIDGTGSNQHWIDWVSAVATRYKGKIKYYEIWNEPSISTSWQGTTAQLVRMAQDAQCVVQGKNCNALSNYSGGKSIDTSAVMLTPAFVTTDQADLVTLFTTYFQAGGGTYADNIAFHGYVGANPPENVASLAGNLMASVTASQGGKPLFDTEGSWGVHTAITDPDEQVAFLSRYVLIQASLGVQRFYWYSWDADPVNLWSQASGTTPAGHAYAEMNTWIGPDSSGKGATFSQACAAQGSVWTCNLTRSGSYQAQAVWDASQTCSNGNCPTSSYTAPSQFTQYLDAAGNSTAINSGATVQIGAKPILLETGNIP